MNKIKTLGLACLALFAISCGGGKEEETPKVKEPTILTTSVVQTTFSPEANTASIIVTCDAPWTMTSSESWLTVSPSSGNGSVPAVTVSASMKINKSTSSRTATLTVKSGTKTAVVNITQKAITEMLPVTEVNLVKAEAAKFRIVTVQDWTATIPADAQDWLKMDPKTGKGDIYVYFQAVDENINVGDRKTTVTINIGGDSVEIPVTQRQKDVILFESGSVAVDYQARSLEVATNTNVNFTVTVAEGSDWLHYVETKALNTMKSTFMVDQNSGTSPRFAKVNFSYGTELTEVLNVAQGPMSSVTTKTLPGLYLVGGTEYAYAAGKDQLSIFKSSEKFGFRLLSPLDIRVVEIAGLPLDVTENMAVDVTIKVLESKNIVLQKNDTAYVVKADDNYLWLALSDGSGAVVKK